MTLLISLLVFAALVLVGYALSALALTRQETQQALANRLTNMAGTASVGATSASLLKDQRLSQIPLLDAILGNTPFVAPLVRMIEQAGLRRRVGEVLLYVVLIFFIVQQQFENHVLVPKVMERQVGVSAVTVIVALLIGGNLFGIVGAILAVPTAAILQVVFAEISKQPSDHS